MPRSFAPPFLLASVLLVAGLLPAQTHSVILSPDVAYSVRSARTGPLSDIDDQESLIVTPTAAPYAARPFRTLTNINVMHGDRNGDGDLDHLSPYTDLNLLMRRQRPPHAENGPLEPGSIWMSAAENTRVATSTATSTLLTHGDVWRARNGNLEVFLRGQVLVQAFASSTATSTAQSVDLDAMVQDTQGNLYVSFYDNESFPTITAANGDLFYVPSTAITYDAAGLITAVARASAQRFASEADFDRLIRNSRAVNAGGTRVNAAGNLSALALDPAGGIWTSPRNALLTAPNMVFGIQGAGGFDNLWTTRNSGQLAVINGVTMGNATSTGAASGVRFGVWGGVVPSGISALVIPPVQNEWIAIDSPVSGKQSAGQFLIEVGRVQPSSPVSLFLSLWAGQAPWAPVTGIPAPGGLAGNPLFELDLFSLAILPPILADADGYVRLPIAVPAGVPSGLDFLVQGAGIPFGAGGLALSATSNLTF